jgi:lipoyl(octanoyl) transferase
MGDRVPPDRVTPDGVVSSRVVEVRRLGTVPYANAAQIQTDLVGRRRRSEISDQLLLLEHPHVITLGSGADPAHVVADESLRRELGIEVARVGRGGDVTYHGPGQLVGYPILDLTPDRKDVHRYMRDLESVLIRTLLELDIEGVRIAGQTGVWTAEGKIAALGIRVSSGWITSHGFALNVSTDLSYFGTIVPCGLSDTRVTSVERILGHPVSMGEVMDLVERAFEKVFGCSMRAASGIP